MLTIVTAFIELPVVMRVTFDTFLTAFCLLEAPTSQIHAAVFAFHQSMKVKGTVRTMVDFHEHKTGKKVCRICSLTLD